MKIAIANDHHGIELKGKIINYFLKNNIEYVNLGCDEENNVDYVDYAKALCDSIKSGETNYGILICGTGIGMSIAANKVKGVRSASVTNEYCAEFTRRHNDLNVLCLGGRTLGIEVAKRIVDIFLNTPFDGGRHLKRVEMYESNE